MVSPKKVVKVMVSATLEDGTVSHFELPKNALIFNNSGMPMGGGQLQMGLVRSMSTSMSKDTLHATSRVSTLEILHVPIRTTGYSGAANTRLSPEEMTQVCRCGHTRGQHMSSAPHPCAEERHCQAFEPSDHVDPAHNPSFVGKCGVPHPQHSTSLAFRGIVCTRESGHGGDHYDYQSPEGTQYGTRWSTDPQPTNNRKDEAEW